MLCGGMHHGGAVPSLYLVQRRVHQLMLCFCCHARTSFALQVVEGFDIVKKIEVSVALHRGVDM